MTDLTNKINTQQIADLLRNIQSDFNTNNNQLAAYLKAKPLPIEMDVYKEHIMFYVDVNENTGASIEAITKYDNSNWLESVAINRIEICGDTDSYSIEGDDSDLLLQVKRIIHDAEHYKLLDEDNAINTNFYHEVYA